MDQDFWKHSADAHFVMKQQTLPWYLYQCWASTCLYRRNAQQSGISCQKLTAQRRFDIPHIIHIGHKFRSSFVEDKVALLNIWTLTLTLNDQETTLAACLLDTQSPQTVFLGNGNGEIKTLNLQTGQLKETVLRSSRTEMHPWVPLTKPVQNPPSLLPTSPVVSQRHLNASSRH